MGYCGMVSCGTRSHIACNHRGWAATCPADRRAISFSQQQMDAIVNLHNSLRQRIASGGQPGFNQAARMATMVR